MGSFSIWHWLVVLAIVIVIFGTKKLRNIGSDVGSAIRNFKQSMKEGEEGTHDETPPAAKKLPKSGRIIDGEVTSRRKKKV